MIQVCDLVAEYGAFSLKRINLSIPAGETFVLVGPSGAGKTLLLETIRGVKPPKQGRILLAGQDMTHLPPEQRQFSYVPQDLALFPHLSVRGNIVFGLDVRNAPKRQIEERTNQVAALLGIEALLDRKAIRSLSGGEKQRVALARSLVVEPRVLFLDEPFGALDAATRMQLLHDMRALHRRLGLTTVLITHDLEEAFVMADRMGIMMAGRIEQVGSPTELHDRPATLRLARFLLVQNVLSGQCVGPGDAPGTCKCQVRGLDVTVSARRQLRPGSSVWIGIRARHVKLTTGRTDSGSNNCFPAVIQDISTRSDKHILTVQVGPQQEFLQVVVMDESGLPSMKSGDKVCVELPPAQLLMFDEDGIAMPPAEQ